QERGVTPSNHPTIQPSNHPTNTYAVVIGISDYQNVSIPDLRFADKDAEAFANFLRSPAGNSLDVDHLKVLINQDATLAQVAMAFSWLMEVAREGDKVIIYFSGHGDVESVSFLQPGFLLCWDAPAKVYMAGGSFSLQMLQTVISSLSLGNKAEVIMIADACRAGKLSGSSINGSVITGTNLAEKYANEIKILSCQPDEYSIEGEQWGGGRGAFSFHLVNGLYGLADRNEDRSVTVTEIDRYLEDHVTPEVAPVSQIPLVMGNKMVQISSVDAELLDAVKTEKNYQTTFSRVDSKGLEDDILATVDPEIRNQYLAFKQALKDQVFLNPLDGQAPHAYADAYFRVLIAEPALARLHSTMHRNYAAALMEGSQQFMNGLIESDANYCGQENRIQTARLKKNISYLERALELLGSDHYMYQNLQAFIYYFEGRLNETAWEQRAGLMNDGYNPEVGNQTLGLYKKALACQKELPQVWLGMAGAFSRLLHEHDSAFHYTRLAMDAVPDWLQAHISMAQIYYDMEDYAASAIWRDKAWQLDSTSLTTLSYIGNWYRERGEEEKAMSYYEKAILAGTPVFCDYVWLAEAHRVRNNYDKTELILKKAESLNQNTDQVYCMLGQLYWATGRRNELDTMLHKIREWDPNSIYGLGLYYMTENFARIVELTMENGEINPNYSIELPKTVYSLMFLGQYEAAEKLFDQKLAANPDDPGSLSGKAFLYTLRRDYDRAEPLLQKALLTARHRKARIQLELAFLAWQQHQEDKARSYVRKAVEERDEAQSFYLFTYFGFHYRNAGRSEEVIPIFQLLLEADPTELRTYIELAKLSGHIGQTSQAMKYIETALEKGYDNYDLLQTDFVLDPLRDEAKWKELTERYFPDKR
ncbi:MAG: tetratricopeptide repeat protein, partial [Bacteroidetes bacterium]